MRSLVRVPLVAAAAVMLLTSTAAAQAGVDPKPSSGVTVTASCVVTRPETTTVWFGYSNTAPERRVALVGDSNSVMSKSLDGLNQGQVTQFQPGVVKEAFAVTMPKGATATWTVTPADILGAPDPSSSASNSVDTPPCDSGARVRSATPQIVDTPVPTISATPVNGRVRNGLLVRSSLQFSTNGVVSACSNGGIPLAPRVLWGYDVTAPGQAGGLVVPAGASFEALALDRVLRTDTNAAGDIAFERSYQATRRIVDPQSGPIAAGTLQEELAGTAQVAWGYSSISVIADVEARCQFPNGIVKSSTTVWVDPTFGSGFNFHTVTDRNTQTTRPAVFCLAATAGCDVRAIGVGPGGRQFR